MPEQKILKGIYKEGPVVASAIITDEKQARVMVRGAEPALPGDTAFTDMLKKVAGGVREHIAAYESRELVAVIEQRPLLIDHISISPDVVEAMGFRWIGVMDRESGMISRRCLSEPLGTALAYTSLKASPFGSIQPGRIDLPPNFRRKTYKELSDQAKQIFSAAVQMSGEPLLKLVAFEDEGLKLLGVVNDFPPARAKAALFDLDALSKEISGGAAISAVAAKLDAIRGG